MTDLTTLSAKELKVIAKEKGLEFNPNASAKDMLEIISKAENPKWEETPEAEENTPNPTEDKEDEEIEDEETPEAEEIEKEKISWEFTVITPIKRNWKTLKAWQTIFFDEIDKEVEQLIADKIIG